MWRYVRRYLPIGILAALLMAGEVGMDLLQPDLISRIVDEGVLGVASSAEASASVSAAAGSASATVEAQPATGNIALIFQLGALMLVFTLVGGVCGSLNNAFAHMFAQNIGNDIRKDALRSIMGMSLRQVDAFGTGSLITRVTNDISQVQTFVATFIRGMIRTGMLTLGSIFFLWRLNATFGLVALASLPFIAGGMLAFLICSNPMFLRLQARLDQVNSLMQEDVSAIRAIKACVREAYEKARFGRANQELVRAQLKILVTLAFMNPLVNASVYLVMAAVVMIGAGQVPQGVTTPGVIVAALTYLTQMLNGILLLVMIFQNLSRGAASWSRLRQVLRTQPEIVGGDFRGAHEAGGQAEQGEQAGRGGQAEQGVRPAVCRTPAEEAPGGSVEFLDVVFSYPDAAEPVLRGLNLTVLPGQTVAIMGATGCGKTTLASLVPRFYDVTGGTVLVDGVDVRDWDVLALRDRVGIALQRSELFADTVEANVSWGNPAADKGRIAEALEIAQATGFVSDLPQGAGTVLAQGGASLSGGQRQRICLARAVLRPCGILILDDATSALDLGTEAAFYSALDSARPCLTKIVVCQRIATARRADRIVVVDGGVVVAEGTHQELLAGSEAYRAIYTSQFGGEADA